MPLNGDLEHFPLVDVIQLLHMTSKSGILHLKSPKGESQLVFHEGSFVSANHLDNSIRIGKVLIDMEAITPDMLNKALTEQKGAGSNRKPLVATLIERGMIDKNTAYKGLEKLIEMTIVEVLTWKIGTFSFDTTDNHVSDEYQYFPEILQMKILLNAQGVLMESLRIYDEKMREGTLHTLFLFQENNSATDALESLSRKVQDVFLGANAAQACKQDVGAHLATTIDQQDELVSFITKIYPNKHIEPEGEPGLPPLTQETLQEAS
jgi:hypothetical protein